MKDTQIKKNKAQNLIEYTLILGIVTMALVGMQAYFKRGVQSVIKVVADDYGAQGDAVGETEIAIKRQKYQNRALTQSTSSGSWTQRRINRGEGVIRTEITGNNTVTGSSFWVGGDYRTRRLQEAKGSSPSSSE